MRVLVLFLSLVVLVAAGCTGADRTESPAASTGSSPPTTSVAEPTAEPAPDRTPAPEFPDGLELKTREGERFLVLNGIQTQSTRAYNLLLELPELAAAGVDVLRISPQVAGTADIVAAFRAAVDGTLAPRAAWQALSAQMPAGACNGFWYGRPGQDLVEKNA
jgi:collagenase-like PrtC family protease